MREGIKGVAKKGGVNFSFYKSGGPIEKLDPVFFSHTPGLASEDGAEGQGRASTRERQPSSPREGETWVSPAVCSRIGSR